MTTLLVLAVTLAVPITLGLVGWYARAAPDVPTPPAARFQRGIVGHLLVFAVVYLALLSWACGTATAKDPAPPDAPYAEQPAAKKQLGVGEGMAFIAVALATGFSVLGASYAVAVVGSAALGALAEKPELFGRTLVFIGLAEGLAIYGLIVSILMLGRL